MPQLFKEVVNRGFKNVILEKPGATTLEELESMAELARSEGVRVGMGYNKNFARYTKQAREEAAKLGEEAETTFIHCNPFTEEGLPECFERNKEGMLRNMMIHEFGLLCTFYGVSSQSVKDVQVMPEFTSHRELVGPQSGTTFADYTRIGFTIVTKDGRKVSARADRCGGNYSAAEVSVGGEVKFSSRMPGDEDQEAMAKLEKETPGCMPYFYLQDREYVELKAAFAQRLLAGIDGVPEGMASLDIGVEALKVADIVGAPLAAFVQSKKVAA
jgi:predicted dehydrogenase